MRIKLFVVSSFLTVVCSVNTFAQKAPQLLGQSQHLPPHLPKLRMTQRS